MFMQLLDKKLIFATKKHKQFKEKEKKRAEKKKRLPPPSFFCFRIFL